MKVVVAIDSFKGSLSSLAAGNAVKEAVLKADNKAEVVVKALADGGEGTVSAFLETENAEAVTLPVTGPLGASRQLHEYTRNHQYGGYWADKCLPIIYNAWPTFWFDINEEKLSALAERAAELGVELFVIDDGWFSTRNNELSGLGDWYPSPEKFPNGLNPLIKKVNASV